MNREIDQFCIDYWESVVYSDEEDTKTNPKPAKPESVTDSIGDDDPDWPDYEEIKAQIEKVSGFPTTQFFHLLRHKCRIEIERQDFESAAMTLLQSQSISFRTQALAQYNIRVQDKKKGQNGNDEDELDKDEMQRNILLFRSPEEERRDLQATINNLPNTWRIVQICVDPRFRESLRFKSTPYDKPFTKANFGLVLVCIDCGGSDKVDKISVHQVDPVESGGNPTILSEFQNIIECHRRIFKAERIEGRAGIKEMMEQVDDRLTSILDTIENKWLGHSKVLLFGKPVDPERIASLDKKIGGLTRKYFSTDPDFGKSGRRKLLERLLDASAHLTKRQIDKGLEAVFCDSETERSFGTFVKDFETCAASLKTEHWPKKRHPVILILDSEIQDLPWEALSLFQDLRTPQPFTRVPSLPFLQVLYANHNEKKTTHSIRNDRIFYVLNPDKNLKPTQERLEPKFQELSLGSGVVGEQPSLSTMKSVLTEWDAYMYCGHGSSLKNVPFQEIEKLRVQAVPLLFGCNSGKMAKLGRQLDPLGTATYYLIATAPCLLGFLWSITDRDTDYWTVRFLEHWIGNGPGSHESQFVRAVANTRGKFSRIINSAATVVYGLPDID